MAQARRRGLRVEVDDCFAFLITWTTYGTWLPGDARGHVSRRQKADGTYVPRKNAFGTEYDQGDETTRVRAEALQRFDAVRLNREQAFAAASGIAKAAMSRGWRIHRATVMANHVHVVVADCPADGPLVRRILKGVSQAAMSSRRKWWTRGGSDRRLQGEQAIAAAINYVANQAGILAEIIDSKPT